MGTKCLITANREEAKLFSIDKGKLEFVKKFENKEGAGLQNEFAPNKAEKFDREVAFTKFLAKNLPKEVHSYTDIVFAAEPRFQGLIKTEMRRHSPQTMIRWLSEDWNNLPSAKIEGLLKT